MRSCLVRRGVGVTARRSTLGYVRHHIFSERHRAESEANSVGPTRRLCFSLEMARNDLSCLGHLSQSRALAPKHRHLDNAKPQVLLIVPAWARWVLHLRCLASPPCFCFCTPIYLHAHAFHSLPTPTRYTQPCPHPARTIPTFFFLLVARLVEPLPIFVQGQQHNGVCLFEHARRGFQLGAGVLILTTHPPP